MSGSSSKVLKGPTAKPDQFMSLPSCLDMASESCVWISDLPGWLVRPCCLSKSLAAIITGAQRG